MSETGKPYAVWRKPVTEDHTWFHLCEMSRMSILKGLIVDQQLLRAGEWSGTEEEEGAAERQAIAELYMVVFWSYEMF